MKTTTLLVGALTLAAASANASTVLFQNDVAGGTPTANLDNTLAATQRHFAVTRIVVPASGWTIDSVTGFVTTGNGFAPGAGPHQAHLHIVPDAGLNAYDPTAGNLVSATLDITTPGSFFSAGVMEVIADAGGVSLAAGTYWMGVTAAYANPALNGIGNGWGGADVVDSMHYAAAGATLNTSITPNVAETWEMIDGPNDNTPAGIAIRIEGSVIPEPSSALLLCLGALGLAYRRRR